LAPAVMSAVSTSWVDENDSASLAPSSMIASLQDACAASGQPRPATVGQLMQCLYRSLSACYRDAIRSLEELTGVRYTSITIVGGGCQDMYLNRMTARATGLPVYAGPVEGTAIGNLAVQMIGAGELADLAAARSCIRRSFDVREILP